eukprot:TRINITY_DN3143_c0_g1_i1.p1 TRINITY_DN3143_c0_g1~~TRINITY_DN3143_c0_g1_i1.p1  ORF type:complete len:290 (-),score=59.21 TRINITY_DN3143_c0_g1_i1:710-1579(-)
MPIPVSSQLLFSPNLGCLLLIAPIRESEGQIVRPAVLTIKPDFVLMRNQPRGPTPESDRRNVLYGLMMANVPSINSCFSEYMNLERPIMFGALQQVKKKLGHDKFPLIDQTYYSSHKQMIIAPEFPVIVKISHAHAGMGKIKLKDNEGFRDLATVMALHKDYCSAEHYYDSQYGIRVQVLGESIRVYKKVFTGSGWKSQFGGSDLQNMEVTDQFREWADECRKLFGGLDIFAIDALHTNEGKDVIIELNGTAIGIHATFYEEDSCIIRDMVVNRMSSIYSPEEIKQPSS